MKLLVLLLLPILGINNFLKLDDDWGIQKPKIKAYSFPMGTTKIATDNVREYKIKFPLSDKDSKITIFLNKYDSQKEEYTYQQVECLNYSKGESRFFSILVDSIDHKIKISLLTPVSMGQFRIDENNNLKYIFIDSEKRNINCMETIFVLYHDTALNEIEKNLKDRKIINDQYHSKNIDTIYNTLKPIYTITYKEE